MMVLVSSIWFVGGNKANKQEQVNGFLIYLINKFNLVLNSSKQRLKTMWEMANKMNYNA